MTTRSGRDQQQRRGEEGPVVHAIEHTPGCGLICQSHTGSEPRPAPHAQSSSALSAEGAKRWTGSTNPREWGVKLASLGAGVLELALELCRATHHPRACLVLAEPTELIPLKRCTQLLSSTTLGVAFCLGGRWIELAGGGAGAPHTIDARGAHPPFCCATGCENEGCEDTKTDFGLEERAPTRRSFEVGSRRLHFGHPEPGPLNCSKGTALQ